MSNDDYNRYDEIADETIKNYVSSLFSDDYAEGWYLSDFVRMPDGKWLIKWKRDIINNPITSEDKS